MIAITREELAERLAQLEAYLPELVQRVVAQNAAIGETQRWIDELDKRALAASVTQTAAVALGRAELDRVQSEQAAARDFVGRLGVGPVEPAEG